MRNLTPIGIVVIGLGLLQTTVCAEEPTTKFSLIAPGDRSAIEANVDQQVIVEGVVSRAAWAKSGKVMSIFFKDSEQTKFQAVVFEKNKDKFDKSFSGDLAKTLLGAKVRVKGKLTMYAPAGGTQKPSPEISLSLPDQITVMELAPSTQPAE